MVRAIPECSTDGDATLQKCRWDHRSSQEVKVSRPNWTCEELKLKTKENQNFVQEKCRWLIHFRQLAKHQSMVDQLDKCYFHFLPSLWIPFFAPAPWSLSEGYCFLTWFQFHHCSCWLVNRVTLPFSLKFSGLAPPTKKKKSRTTWKNTKKMYDPSTKKTIFRYQLRHGFRWPPWTNRVLSMSWACQKGNLTAPRKFEGLTGAWHSCTIPTSYKVLPKLQKRRAQWRWWMIAWKLGRWFWWVFLGVKHKNIKKLVNSWCMLRVGLLQVLFFD